MNFLAYNLLNFLNSSPLFSKFMNWSYDAAAGLNKIVLLISLDNFMSSKTFNNVFFKLLVTEKFILPLICLRKKFILLPTI